MPTELDDIRGQLDGVLTRQAQIEQGLHMLLDAIAVQAPLLAQISDDTSRTARQADALALYLRSSRR